MKKLLSLLAAFSLTTTTTFGVISCGSGQESGGELSTTDNQRDIREAAKAHLSAITAEQKENTTTDFSQLPSITEGIISISEAGNYKLSGEIEATIIINADNVHLYLENTTIKSDAKVIDSKNDLIITLNGENFINNTQGTESSNAISVDAALTINGDGTLEIESTKSAIKTDKTFYALYTDITISAQNHGVSAAAIIILDAQITVLKADKDALHAEVTDQPTFTYQTGFVIIDGGVAQVNATNILGDGIQSSTFTYIGTGKINIQTTPTFIEATSADGLYQKNLDGTFSKISQDDIQGDNYSNYYQLESSNKGIKTGELTFVNSDSTETTVKSDKYGLLIEDGDITIDSGDDALHTNSGDIYINGGTFNINTLDKAIHADNIIIINEGLINVEKSYEGIEAIKIYISGGGIQITASDDGINAASSNLSSTEQLNQCLLSIESGSIFIDAGGDGLDSNGNMLISGGTVFVSAPGNGDGAIDAGGDNVIYGGTVVALGSSSMVQKPSTNSTQNVIVAGISTTSETGISLVDSSANELVSFNTYKIFGTEKTFTSVIISSSKIKSNKTYLIKTGTQSTSVTISGTITSVNISDNNRPGQGKP